jgi:hypothetical protein
MNLSDTLLITARGAVEVRDQIANLDTKARGVLLTLAKAPRTIGELVGNLPLERADALLRIDALLKEGFVSNERAGSRSATQAEDNVHAAQATGRLELKAGIFLSEARFLLTDFCLDFFGGEADKLVNAVEDADGVAGLNRCLQDIGARLAKKDPKAMPSLQRIVAVINETAQ